jgi:hypothetical protein
VTLPKAKRFVAWVMFIAGTGGLILALVRVIGPNEPYLTLVLSWAALAYAGFVALEVT